MVDVAVTGDDYPPGREGVEPASLSFASWAWADGGEPTLYFWWPAEDGSYVEASVSVESAMNEFVTLATDPNDHSPTEGLASLESMAATLTKAQELIAQAILFVRQKAA